MPLRVRMHDPVEVAKALHECGAAVVEGARSWAQLYDGDKDLLVRQAQEIMRRFDVLPKEI